MPWLLRCDPRCNPLCVPSRAASGVDGRPCPSIRSLLETSRPCNLGRVPLGYLVNDQFLRRPLLRVGASCPRGALGFRQKAPVPQRAAKAVSNSVLVPAGTDTSFVSDSIPGPLVVRLITLLGKSDAVGLSAFVSYRLWLSQDNVSASAPAAGDYDLGATTTNVGVVNQYSVFPVGQSIEWPYPVLFVKGRFGSDAANATRWTVAVNMDGSAGLSAGSLVSGELSSESAGGRSEGIERAAFEAASGGFGGGSYGGGPPGP